MSDYEREEIREAILKYCELDTMAMVMLCDGFWGTYCKRKNKTEGRKKCSSTCSKPQLTFQVPTWLSCLNLLQ